MGHAMTDRNDVQYHSERARRELDLGLTASSTVAARAHLRLSSLHFQKLRELDHGMQPIEVPLPL
jgi:hypothetical protein